MFRKIFSYSGPLFLAGAIAFVTPGVSQGQHGGGGHGGGGHGGGGHAGGGHVGGGHFGGSHSGGAHFNGGHFGGTHSGGHQGGYYHHGYGGYYHGGHHHYPGYGYGLYGYYPYYDSGPYYGDYYPYDYYGSSPSYDSGYTGSVVPADPYPYSAPNLQPDWSNYPAYQPAYSSAPSAVTSTVPAHGNAARLTVRVPPNAQVWFEGSETTSRGAVREFQSPPLTPGSWYVYEIRARWNDSGHETTQTQKVEVSAGSHVTVNFPVLSTTAGQTSAVNKS
jgi:uncharacterized protein (TIGR03000 family)